MLVEAILVGGEKILAHPPEKCAGEYCCIHSPSDHHMKNWKQHWRNDTKVMERICQHGVGHPDPDHLASIEDPTKLKLDSIHGCDLCCTQDRVSYS